MNLADAYHDENGRPLPAPEKSPRIVPPKALEPWQIRMQERADAERTKRTAELDARGPIPISPEVRAAHAHPRHRTAKPAPPQAADPEQAPAAPEDTIGAAKSTNQRTAATKTAPPALAPGTTADDLVPCHYPRFRRYIEEEEAKAAADLAAAEQQAPAAVPEQPPAAGLADPELADHEWDTAADLVGAEPDPDPPPARIHESPHARLVRLHDENAAQAARAIAERDATIARRAAAAEHDSPDEQQAKAAKRRAGALKSAATVRARREQRQHDAAAKELMDKRLDSIGRSVINRQQNEKADAAQAEADPGIPTYRSLIVTARAANAEADLFRLAHIARAPWTPADWPASTRQQLAESLKQSIADRTNAQPRGAKK